MNLGPMTFTQLTHLYWLVGWEIFIRMFPYLCIAIVTLDIIYVIFSFKRK